MRGRDPDPDDLPREWSPSVVEIADQGAVFVADAQVRDDGWLSIREWGGQRVKLPPHRVRAVKRLDTESVDDGLRRRQRLTDDDWRAKAKNGHGQTTLIEVVA